MVDNADGATRGHSLKLFKRRDWMLGSISSATGCAINGLVEDMVMAGCLVTFKAKLDHLLRNVRG